MRLARREPLTKKALVCLPLVLPGLAKKRMVIPRFERVHAAGQIHSRLSREMYIILIRV